MVKIAILGYGTVGSGVAEVLDVNRDEVSLSAWQEISIGYILDLRDFPGDPHEEQVVHDFETIIADPEIRVICETMGGLEPAYTFTKRALEKGISVVTSNKELVAAHGPELVALAKDHKCSYLFEASVGGGIPVLRPMNTSLLHERIDSITGILNGTTNYILTRMATDGAEFDEVLREAQEKGYAERNPEADVEGYDACRKTAILASLASGEFIRYEDIPTRGITEITPLDFAYARAMNRAIRLLGVIKRDESGFFTMVAPFLIPMSHPLAGVTGVYNAIVVHGNMLGNVMFYGQGAGKRPTASAVVSDLVYAVQHEGRHIPMNLHLVPPRMKESGAMEHRFFVRVDEAKKQEAVRLFGTDIRMIEADGVRGEFGFLTSPMTEARFSACAKELQEIKSYLRLLDEA